MTRPEDEVPEGDEPTGADDVSDPDQPPAPALAPEPEPEEDDLFAAVAAAMSRPPRRDSEAFGSGPQNEDEQPEDEPTADEQAEEESTGDVDHAVEPIVEPADEIDLDDEDDEADPDEDDPIEGDLDEPDDEVEDDEPVVVLADEPDEEPVDDVPAAAVDDTASVVAADRTVLQPSVDAYDDLFYPPPAPDTAVAAPADYDPFEGSYDDEDPPRRLGRRLLVGALLLLGAAYVGGYFLTGLRLPADASVAGVDVSGASPADARATLTRELGPRTEQPVVLTHEKKQFTIDPADAGLTLDVPGSVEAVGGTRSWDPRDMAALFFGTHDHDAVVETETSKLSGVLGTIGEAVDVPVVQPQITFPNGKAKARKPREGRVVDRTATTEVLEHAFVGDAESADVVLETVQPEVDLEGLREALGGIAKTAVSGPVAIKVGEKSIDLPVTAYSPALVIRVEDGAMAPYIDPEKLAEPLSDATTGIGKKAVDATVELQNGKPVVVPGKEGVGLQPEEMATKLLPAVAATGDDRSVSIEAKVVEPAFTTEDAKNLKITEKISEFTTQYPPAAYRDTNQGRAAELIDGTVIKPGETFSFNDIVGERTQANGFVSGTVINGGVFREELGGGVSQVATTTYNAAFFGGMDDVEHHPHAFYIDRYPVGREATVYWGSLDLRWKNSTDYGVLVHAYVERSAPGRNGRMHVELWSTKVWDEVKAGQSAKRNFRSPGKQYDDSNRCVAQSPIQGFDIDIYRSFYKDGKRVKTETDTAVYQAADTVICGKKPKPKSSSSDD